VRVVSAQPQAQQSFTNPNPQSKPQTTSPPHPLPKAAIARSFPSPPAPLPDPGRGEQNRKTSRAFRQVKIAQIASLRASSLLPLARWRERGPGGEGGDRANPSATKLYAHRSQASAIARKRASALPPLARWRERGPGGEGGVRANPSATKLYKPKPPIKTTNNLTAPSPPESSRCAVFPLTPGPSPRPGARGAKQ